MATVLIPHSWNQSARRWRSSVKVPNVRTGSEARSGPTAATCIFDPTSMAAARGWMGDIARDGTGLFVPVMPASPCVAKQRGGLGCAGYQFPNRDHREASPLSSAQQSMDHVFLRDHPPPKICRPLPSAVRSYRGTVSLATGGPQVGEGFLEVDGRLGALQALLEPGVFPLCLGQLSRQRIGFARFRAAPGRSQGAEGAGFALAAPVGQGR